MHGGKDSVCDFAGDNNRQTDSDAFSAEIFRERDDRNVFFRIAETVFEFFRNLLQCVLFIFRTNDGFHVALIVFDNSNVHGFVHIIPLIIKIS